MNLSYIEYLNELRQRIKKLTEESKEILAGSKLRTKERYDRLTNPQEFNTGDLVWLKKESTSNDESNTLNTPFEGPILIISISQDECKSYVETSFPTLPNLYMEYLRDVKFFHETYNVISYINLDELTWEESEISKGLTIIENLGSYDFEKEESKLQKDSLITQMCLEIELALMDLDKNIGILFQSLTFAKTGQINPQLLSPDISMSSIKLIRDERGNKEMSIIIENGNYYEYLEISDLTIAVIKYRLVYIIKIPISELGKYKAYRVMPSPKLVEDKILAYISTPDDYIITNDEKLLYTPSKIAIFVVDVEVRTVVQNLEVSVTLDNFPSIFSQSDSDGAHTDSESDHEETEKEELECSDEDNRDQAEKRIKKQNTFVRNAACHVARIIAQPSALRVHPTEQTFFD
ncbi:hypothetical protein PV328_004138 [Microctonus aethiopoides]|uniref:Uncharacterized protein n=1 Tax=Microctonus aethiopoides TaxID=144406 RepID=A0AA39F9Y9_9HYME|nr:hypothetical protein PV328_004138 [Microctonus aethiopoides]